MVVESRLWRPAAQRNVRNAWSYIHGHRSSWSSASAAALSAATSLVNAYLLHGNVEAMEFGVLADMEGIKDKARKKLLSNQRTYLRLYLSSYEELVQSVLQMTSAATSMKTYTNNSGDGPLITFTNIEATVDGDSGDGGGVPVFSTLPLCAHGELKIFPAYKSLFLRELFLLQSRAVRTENDWDLSQMLTKRTYHQKRLDFGAGYNHAPARPKTEPEHTGRMTKINFQASSLVLSESSNFLFLSLECACLLLVVRRMGGAVEELLASEIVNMFQRELKVKWLLASEFCKLVYPDFGEADSVQRRLSSPCGNQDMTTTSIPSFSEAESREKKKETTSSQNLETKKPSRKTLQVYLTALLAEVYSNKNRIEEISRISSEEMTTVGLFGPP